MDKKLYKVDELGIIKLRIVLVYVYCKKVFINS